MTKSKMIALVLSQIHIELLLKSSVIEPYEEDFKVSKGDYAGMLIRRDDEVDDPVALMELINSAEIEVRKARKQDFIEAYDQKKEVKSGPGNDFLRSKGHFGG